jgi:crotonobetainyl-CoA:carnitine CoA-transferase CaiB-like acyl-CoA transferase
MVRIFGSTQPAEADHAGHDLTYQAEAGLTDHGQLPASLFADMTGAVMASEAVLQVLMARARNNTGHCLDIGLAQAAQWLALPRQWQMTTAQGDVGGAHAGYRMYRCQDGWVALAALEPHFALRICQAVGLTDCNGSVQQMRTPTVHTAIETFMQRHSRSHIAAMAAQSDIPLHLIADHPE